jgi:cell division protein FtsB
MSQQVDINKVIESLTRQIAEYAHKVSFLEAYIKQLEERLKKD